MPCNSEAGYNLYIQMRSEPDLRGTGCSMHTICAYVYVSAHSEPSCMGSQSGHTVFSTVKLAQCLPQRGHNISIQFQLEGHSLDVPCSLKRSHIYSETCPVPTSKGTQYQYSISVRGTYSSYDGWFVYST